MQQREEEVTFKGLFVPFTTTKAIVGIVLIGFTVYFNSLFNGFVGDDSAQILDNSLVHSITNLPLFFKGSTLHVQQLGATVGIYYKPLLVIAFSLIYSFFGPNAFFFHTVQLLLHISTSVVIFLILKKHFHKFTSFLLCLFFLLHPINNEAVVYISNLQEELFALFGFLSLYFFMNGKSLIFVTGFLLLSLLSKESGIIFFPMVIIYGFLFRDGIKQKMNSFLISLGVVFALYVGLRVFVGNIGIQTKLLYMSENASLLQRLFTIPAILLYYLKMVLFPVAISFGWYFVVKQPTLTNFEIPLFVSVLCFAVLLIPLASLRSLKRWWKLYLFFLLSFFISISIALQIVPLDITVADRWFYVPLFGLLGLVGVFSEWCSTKLSKASYFKLGGLVLITAVLLLFSTRDVIRNSDWKDSFTLCKHDEQINTRSYLLEYCLGNEYKNQKKYSLAELHARKAIDLYPQHFLSWYTLGNIYIQEGYKDKAELAFRKTLTLNSFGQGSGELALILVYDKKPEQAKEVAEKYLKIIPNSAQLWYANALADYQLGNQEEAISAAQKAYILESTTLTEKVYYGFKQHLPIKL